MADATVINDCKVAIFWKPSGAAIDSGRTTLGRYEFKNQCAAPKSVLSVVDYFVKNHGDSVVVEGSTRIGNVGRAETHVFKLKDLAISFQQYRIGRLSF